VRVGILGTTKDGVSLRFLNPKYSRLAPGAIFVTAIAIFPNSKTSAQQLKPDFSGAEHFSCAIQTTSDNLGKTNGYIVRLDIQYKDSLKPRWNHPMRMFRPEDRKKAGQFCLSMYKQYFREEEKQFEASEKQIRRRSALRPSQEAAIKSSLVPTF
jgi:hypothetical protein